MRVLTFLLITLLSTNCFAADLIARAKQDIRESSIDSSSIKFRKVFVHKKYVCGQVNGRNQFGGYSGWHLFIWDNGDHMVLDNPDRPDDTSWDATWGRAYKQKCID